MAADVRRYLISFPERVARAVLGLGAGVVREVGEVALPEGFRQGQLYQNMVETTLRFLTERVGGAEPAGDRELPDNFVARRTAGNAIELLGIVAFRASPVWVLAALADVCGAGRALIPEIAGALKAQGLLDRDAQFASVDEILDGLEKTSSRLAANVNTPPLDVAALRDEWRALKEDTRGLQPESLPSTDALVSVWQQLVSASAQQGTTVFQTASMMAVTSVRSLPANVRWLSAASGAAAARTGQVLAAALFDHYRQTLAEIQQTGYFTYAGEQLRPYVHAAVRQFSPAHRTITERLLDRIESLRK
jgi:hypothetical protein